MAMMWFRKRTKDDEQRDKIAESQRILMDAAVSTADMAQFVTTKLKDCLTDAIKQFEVTTSIMSDGLLIYDTTGKMKACNPAALLAFDYTTADFMQKSVIDLFRNDGRIITTVDELWSILGPEQHTLLLTGVRRHGEEFPVEATMTRLGRADGSVIMLMLIRDMSGLMAIKEESDAHARRWRALFELCFDGIVVVHDGKIVAANQQAGRLFGVRPDSLLSVHFTRLFNEPDQDMLERIHVHPVASTATHDGKPMSLLLSGTKITWKNGTASLITIRDIKHALPAV